MWAIVNTGQEVDVVGHAVLETVNGCLESVV